MNKKSGKPANDEGSLVNDEFNEEALSRIPVAKVDDPSSESSTDVAAWAWLVPLVALLIAFGLVWWSLPSAGVSITVHFPEGHGLQPEDIVRFRGIDVGVVEQVKLNSELSGIDVGIQLRPFAGKLAREGTRFWIVRPELSLTEISGLETAVGHKYIGLLPGDPDNSRQFHFEGLSEMPPDADAETGFEIIIRGDERYSINPGSPVTCRGVEVGRVLSVGLSQNARFVDVRARIYEKYRGFLNSETRFWASSGVNFDFSIGGGLKLEAESLETIAKGGVSLLTISSQGMPVQSGQVFKLYPRPEEDWLAKAENVRINNIKIGYAAPLEVRWKQKGLFRAATKNRTFGGIAVRQDDQFLLVVPKSVLDRPAAANEGTFELGVAGSADLAIADAEALDYARKSAGEGDLAFIKLESQVANELGLDWCGIDADTRAFEAPEDCLAVRAAGKPGEFEYLHYSIDKDLLFFTDDQTLGLRFFDGDENIWNGAPVQSVSDGKIIGVLLTDEKRTVIVPMAKR